MSVADVSNAITEEELGRADIRAKALEVYASLKAIDALEKTVFGLVTKYGAEHEFIAHLISMNLAFRLDRIPGMRHGIPKKEG